MDDILSLMMVFDWVKYQYLVLVRVDDRI
jgi:hypothetical protein